MSGGDFRCRVGHGLNQLVQIKLAGKRPTEVIDRLDNLGLFTQLLLGALALRDVAGDFRGSNDSPVRYLNRRNGERDIQERSILVLPDSLVVLYALSAPEPREDGGFFIRVIRRYQ